MPPRREGSEGVVQQRKREILKFDRRGILLHQFPRLAEEFMNANCCRLLIARAVVQALRGDAGGKFDPERMGWT